MEPVIRTEPDSLAACEDDWRALWERDPTASLFQRPEYLAIWLTEFGGDRKPLFVEVRDAGVLRGFAALSFDPDGVLRFLGDPALTDYFGPIASPEDREAVAAELARALAATDGWSSAELLGLSSDAGWVEPLARALKAAGLAVTEERQDVCPRLTLGGSYEDYLGSLDGKQRHETKRKARKLEREAGSYEVRLVTGAEVHDDMERFFELYRSSEGPKGRFAHWGLAGFFILLAHTFGKHGWLRLSLLEVRGEPWAAVFSFRNRDVWNVYNAAYDDSRRALGPGIVLMAETIRLATEEGCRTFDLMRGDEPYKYRLGASDVPLMKLMVSR